MLTNARILVGILVLIGSQVSGCSERPKRGGPPHRGVQIEGKPESQTVGGVPGSRRPNTATQVDEELEAYRQYYNRGYQFVMESGSSTLRQDIVLPYDAQFREAKVRGFRDGQRAGTRLLSDRERERILDVIEEKFKKENQSNTSGNP